MKKWLKILLLLAMACVTARAGEIHDAVRAGDLAKVKQLLAYNPKLVKAREDNGDTPLLVACEPDLVKLSDPLQGKQMCARKNCIAVAELLLACKADVNAKRQDGDTPLHCAVSYGNEDLVKLLLANKANANAKNWSGLTPLHYAFGEDIEVVKLLLASNADVNAKDKSGATLLHYAAARDNDLKLAELLLSHKADVNARGQFGWTPLSYAYECGVGDSETAKLLRKKGGRNTRSVPDRVRDAVNTNDATGLKILLKEHPELATTNVEINPANRFGGLHGGLMGETTLLHIAAERGCRDAAEVLIAFKADVNARDTYGRTPLTGVFCRVHSWNYAKEKPVVELLLANKAIVDPKLADHAQNAEMAELLRKHCGKSGKELGAAGGGGGGK